MLGGPTVDSAPPDVLFPPLGYKGIELSFAPGEPGFATIVGDFVLRPAQSPTTLRAEESVEGFLLQSAPSDVTEEISFLAKFTAAAATAFRGFSLELIPPYDPHKWNRNRCTLRTNNCYNYSVNEITNTFAQPGRASGTPGDVDSCDDAVPAAVGDGLVRVASPQGKPANGHYVALVLRKKRDFHWYRQDDNGLWSHKPGSTPVRNWDNRGRIIESPETCDRGPYKLFCGYFLADETKVVIS